MIIDEHDAPAYFRWVIRTAQVAPDGIVTDKVESVDALELWDQGLPIEGIASVLKHPPLEITRTLRKAGRLKELQPVEAAYIRHNIDLMHSRQIVDHLGLTSTQLEQFLRRFGIRREELTLDICTSRTRRLVEDVLRFGIDDELPRKIDNNHFVENSMFSVITFAEREKSKSVPDRYFTAVAFLICNAYPGQFKGFQFRHAKTNTFFAGEGGKQNFLQAMKWLVTEKCSLSLEDINLVSEMHTFLSTGVLQFYGLGPKQWRQQWSTKDEMLADLKAYVQAIIGNDVHRAKSITSKPAKDAIVFKNEKPILSARRSSLKNEHECLRCSPGERAFQQRSRCPLSLCRRRVLYAAFRPSPSTNWGVTSVKCYRLKASQKS